MRWGEKGAAPARGGGGGEGVESQNIRVQTLRHYAGQRRAEKFRLVRGGPFLNVKNNQKEQEKKVESYIRRNGTAI